MNANNGDRNNVFDLEETHKKLLSKFLTFFKSKQEKFVKEIKFEIEEEKEKNVKEMMFSKKEVSELIDTLKDKITYQMDKEMSYYLNMNGRYKSNLFISFLFIAIFVQLLLHKADENKVTLYIETSQVQNLENVNEMSEFIKSVISSNIPEFGKSNVMSKLGSITKTQNLINDYEQLKHDYEMLNQNYGILKNQNEMLVKENKNLESSSNNYSDEVNSLRNEVMKLSINCSVNAKPENLENISKLQTDLEGTKKKLDEQLSKYQNLVKEYDVKLSESIQFQQLKKFLQEKNTLIIQLKNKLAKVEEPNK